MCFWAWSVRWSTLSRTPPIQNRRFRLASCHARRGTARYGAISLSSDTCSRSSDLLEHVRDDQTHRAVAGGSPLLPSRGVRSMLSCFACPASADKADFHEKTNRNRLCPGPWRPLSVIGVAETALPNQLFPNNPRVAPASERSLRRRPEATQNGELLFPFSAFCRPSAFARRRGL